MKTFEGYRRENGKIGVRNHVIVINTVGELASFTKKLAQLVPEVIPVSHQTGKAQFPEDLQQTLRTLKGTAGHPNVSAALFLGMGQGDPAEEMVELLKDEGHYVHAIYFYRDKTITDILKEGKLWLEEAVKRSKQEQREIIDITELTIGLECGGSDAWSGVTANPAIGVCSDALIKDGGTSILAETTEAIGAEHILANRSVTSHIAKDFLKIVRDYEKRIRATGEDIRSANPTPGNMAGGLTTLEEKSLGCIKKGGDSPLMEVVNYAQPPTEKGFIFMDTPGYDVESVAGLAAGGAQVVLFSTGKGSPTGSPIVPVIKIGTNPKLYEIMSEHIDVNAGKIVEGINTIEEIGEEIYRRVLDTANGDLTAAEKHKNQEFAIWRLAETM
ncbi:UxaA family hydrolase [Priestia filamentosa]|uniref:Hydrolase n=1 Tax=Priestia filamentosa TaxID=1402861 RepID=A0A0H4KHB5_9BACI|nr:UxaA family hydrolase [Priestia filamentosa]AKO92995.1 hydrolase [Priestia filamentosa]RJS63698.1 hydrolase [Priestia filamentosa]WCM14157.1 UxaA family hydrolase [Priestia filamentosa]